ncbi:Arylsulfatase [Desulfovibrio ferrophilus]|uniref:Arylsulfatase n=1 Tax=Desulfovibrio ferrophilus TaxID=241368 RepID=A0A2Z6AZM8_9BACT|nr:Arylsulfatase [Desulfovibrio ferrophilus]
MFDKSRIIDPMRPQRQGVSGERGLETGQGFIGIDGHVYLLDRVVEDLEWFLIKYVIQALSAREVVD